MPKPKWIELALRLAEAARLTSVDKFVQVGAAVLREDGSVCGVGYNGYPPGFDLDAQESSDREYRRDFMVHAETNALAYAVPGEPFLLAVTYPPCKRCILEAARYGVKFIVCPQWVPVDIWKFATRLGITVGLPPSSVS
jgi:deoxycytidylate deaminase